jgi:hypothetical protein
MKEAEGMGTRLLAEAKIKQYYPHLKYVRAHTCGRHRATLYAWDEELCLSEHDAAQLQKYAEGYLGAYICFRVKPYSKLREDRIARDFELPDRIVEAALQRDLDQSGILSVMNGMLAEGTMRFCRYDCSTGTLQFAVDTPTALTVIEQELVQRYLSELIPLGSRCELIYETGKSRILHG